jgi:hypothetical protein
MTISISLPQMSQLSCLLLLPGTGMRLNTSMLLNDLPQAGLGQRYCCNVAPPRICFCRMQEASRFQQVQLIAVV